MPKQFVSLFAVLFHAGSGTKPVPRAALNDDSEGAPRAELRVGDGPDEAPHLSGKGDGTKLPGPTGYQSFPNIPCVRFSSSFRVRVCVLSFPCSLVSFRAARVRVCMSSPFWMGRFGFFGTRRPEKCSDG